MLTDKQRQQTALRQQRFRQRQQEARRLEQASQGLPSLPKIATLPGYPRWRAALASAQALVTQVQEEMVAYYDARSDVWQEGDVGAQFLERQEAVEAILSAFEELTL
jgi:hypothetical protein